MSMFRRSRKTQSRHDQIIQFGAWYTQDNMHINEYTYISLLADVASSSGFSEIRGSYEGLQWCLTEAPKLEKYLLSCLESGQKPDLDRFPRWLHRLVAGSIDDPCLLRFVRQLLLFSYKAYVQHDNTTTEAAFSSFISVNREVGEFAQRFAKASPLLLNLARQNCQSVLYRFRGGAIVPQHGPGASTTPKEKWTNWYPTIETVYPYSDYLHCYFNSDSIASMDDLQSCDHIRAKLIAVPKDSRGPRLICVHPAESIWIQQGVRKELERAISLERHQPSFWPRGKIKFDDQTVNGRIALDSSRHRKYATLDMKEASDRISDILVQNLFGRYYKYFGCCRAQKYYIPAGSKIKHEDDIHCYAPMGNATTFPVQSLVFWAICCASLQYRGWKQPGAAFVFGDDIIVPSQMAQFVIDDLESFGVLVNRQKSFYKGYFRESCGVDAYKGVDVTPIRWKCDLDAKHLTGLQSLSMLAMRLRIGGYEEAATTCYGKLRHILKHNYGEQLFYTNNVSHGGIAEYTSNAINAFSDAKWHKGLQWYHTPVVRIEMAKQTCFTHGWNHVLESICGLTTHGHYVVPDRSVSRRMRLARGWMAVV
jgi:hypothetical protein